MGNKDCFGHGGDDMETEDPYASYPESHFTETDDRYLDSYAEDTEETNLRALRELEELRRIQEEESELYEEEERLRQELVYEEYLKSQI